jgi:hypothetical protein
VANRGGQAGEVVHGADEYNTQSNPEKTGKPSEGLASENWAGNWSGGRNSRKVLSKKIERSGGNEIDAIIYPISRSCVSIVELKLSCQPPSVKPVGSHKQYEKSERQKRQRHAKEPPHLSL